MVAEPEDNLSPQPDGAEIPDGESSPEPGTPDYYLMQLDAAEKAMETGQITELEFKRKSETWTLAAKNRGIDLAAHSLSRMEPIRRLLMSPNLLERNEEELLRVKEAMEKIDLIEANLDGIKKKWMELIDLAIRLQHEAVTSAVKLTVYVVRCQETNQVLDMSEMHVEWFRIWADEQSRHSLIEAPPGTGKTTCLYGVELNDFRTNQNLRILRASGDLDTACKRLAIVRDYILSPRYQAIAPHVKIDYTKPCGVRSFTLKRDTYSQDPSMQAVGALSEYQGAGFERIDCDDLCPDKVQWEESLRKKIWKRLNGTTLKRVRDWAVSKVRYIGTPWHSADATSQLHRRILDGEMPNWRTRKFPRREDADGNPLPLYDRPDWSEQRLQLIAQKRNDPEGYACTELLDPPDKYTVKFNRPHFYDVSGGKDPLCPEHRREFYEKLLTAIQAGQRWHVIDPAAGGSDFTGMLCFSLSIKGTAALISAHSWTDTADNLLDELANVVTSEGNDKVLMEGQGGGKAHADIQKWYMTTFVGSDYADKMEIAGTHFGNQKGKGSGQNMSKIVRWRAALPYLNNGVILFPGKWVKSDVNQGARLVPVDDAEMAGAFDQLTQYPNTSQDQYVDCVSMFIHHNFDLLAKSIQALRKERAEEQRRQGLSRAALLRAEMIRNRMNPKRPSGDIAREIELLAAG